MHPRLLFAALPLALALCLQVACRPKPAPVEPAKIPGGWRVVSWGEVAKSGVEGWESWPAHLLTAREFLARGKPLPGSTCEPAFTRDTLDAAMKSLAECSAGSGTDFWKAAEERFHLLRLRGTEDALATGYYTPEFDARLKPEGAFVHPVYAAPKDLVGSGKKYERVAIDRDGCLKGKGLEIAYLAEPLHAYILQVQGSGVLILEDGRRMGVGVGGTNNLPYVSMGRELVKDNRIAVGDISLPTIRAWFAAHPEQFTDYAWRNPRYVFFKPYDGPPCGSMGAPVAALHSVATERYDDGRYRLPPFAPMVLRLNLPRGGVPSPEATSLLVLNQDTGSAIQGEARLDLYTGVGAKAEDVAGVLKGHVDIHLLWPKSKPLPASIGGLPVYKSGADIWGPAAPALTSADDDRRLPSERFIKRRGR